MVEAKLKSKKHVGRPKSSKKSSAGKRTVKKSSSHKRGRPALKKSASRVIKSAKSSALKDLTVLKLKKLAKKAGVKQSKKGHVLRKSALIRALKKEKL